MTLVLSLLRLRIIDRQNSTYSCEQEIKHNVEISNHIVLRITGV